MKFEIASLKRNRNTRRKKLSPVHSFSLACGLENEEGSGNKKKIAQQCEKRAWKKKIEFRLSHAQQRRRFRWDSSSFWA